jgi:internalin A
MSHPSREVDRQPEERRQPPEAPDPSLPCRPDGVGIEGENAVRDLVFISYSHQDKRFLDELLTHLKPYLRTRITAWSDRQIQPGSQWFDEIKDALARTSVAVMLVSPNFLGSDFIHEHELGPLLRDAEAGGVRILWVLIRDCSWKETPLKGYQAAAPTDKPFAKMRVSDRDTAWRTVCEEIKRATSRPQTAHRSPPAPRR